MPSTTRAAACRSMASSWSPRIAAPLRTLRRQRSPAAAGAGGIHVRRWAERSASHTGCPRTCPATAHLARAPCSERLGAAEVRAVSARAHPSIHPSIRARRVTRRLNSTGRASQVAMCLQLPPRVCRCERSPRLRYCRRPQLLTSGGGEGSGGRGGYGRAQVYYRHTGALCESAQ